MRSIFRRTTEPVPQTLDLYDVACLAGGARRMMEVALVALHERGMVRVRVSRVRAVDGAVDQPDAHPFECAVVDLCRRRSRETYSLFSEVRIAPEVEEIERRLVSCGLLTRKRRLTYAGGQHLEAAERSGAYPAYVFNGPAALPEGVLRRNVGGVTPSTPGLGRRLIRLGDALGDWASEHGGDSDSGGHSCGGGGGGSD
ncbi:TIGR04222 domain-containing membrane protein [Streptomyces sp. NPDC001700]